MKLKRNILYTTLISAFLLLTADICMGQSADGRIRTVVVDPGHGGKDAGTVYGNHHEKDINLAVGLLLGEMIKREMPDVEVIYTRKTDVFVDLDVRGAIANKAKADLFISIHVNAVDRKTNVPSGALTLIMGTEHMERNLDQAMKENQVIVYEQDYTTKYEEYLSGSSEMFIIYSLTQYVNIEQSINFANILQQYYKTDTPMPDKGIRRQKLLVLWYTTMPGILTELGFLNNEHDRKVLTSAKGQKQMATAIFSALRDYKAQVDAKAKPLQVEQKGGGNTAAQKSGSGAATQENGSGAAQKGGKNNAGNGSDGAVQKKGGNNGADNGSGSVSGSGGTAASAQNTGSQNIHAQNIRPQDIPAQNIGAQNVPAQSDPQRTETAVGDSPATRISGTPAGTLTPPASSITIGGTTAPTSGSTTVGTTTPSASGMKGETGIVYRIQILSSMKKVPSGSSEMKDYRGQTVEKYDGTRYRYYVGECRTYAEAIELQTKVRKAFPDAFTVAFNGEKNITVPEARKLTD